MAVKIVKLDCPGCGAPISTETKNCPYCDRPIVISTFNSIRDMMPQELSKYAAAYRKALGNEPGDENLNLSLAFCYLRLKMYEKASVAFDKALDEDLENAEAYFYAAIAMLGGKKAFVAQRSVIDRIDEYMNAALMLEPRGIFYYFWAYVKYDYYERKFINTSPDYRSLLKEAGNAGYSAHDTEELFALLGVNKPSGF